MELQRARGSKSSEFPPACHVHGSIRVILLLQLLENWKVLAIDTGQRGIINRVVVIPRRVPIQRTLFLSNEVPETSSSLSDGSEVIRVVRRVLPLEEDTHRGSDIGGVTSRIWRVS